MSKQTVNGWTLADLQAVPEDCKVEVLDGAPLVRASPLPVHQRMTRRFAAALESQLSDFWQLETNVSLLLADAPLDCLCPDVVVFGSLVSLNTRFVPGAEVLLVVEIAGARPETATAYARAGIPHYWRFADGALHTFALDRGSYVSTGVHSSRVETSLGEPVSIDLSSLV